MADTKSFENLANKLHEKLLSGIKNLGENIEPKAREIIQNQVGKLNLVSREQFDIQTKVLQRSREKQEQLEQQITQLEQRVNNLEAQLTETEIQQKNN